MARRRMTIEFDYDESAEPDSPESYDAAVERVNEMGADIITDRDV